MTQQQTIQDVLLHFGIEIAPAKHHHVRKGWVGVDCPRCSPGRKKFRLGFELATGRVNCWVCGRLSGPAALQQLLNVPEKRAKGIWAQLKFRNYRAEPEKLGQGTLVLPAGVAPMQAAHTRYLASRGFNPDTIESLWGVQGIGLATRLQWRLFLPIKDIRGRTVSWTTRALSEHADLRYISAKQDEEEIPHKSILYGAHLASHVIIVNEGPIDAWAWGPGGVATCGVGYSKAQLRAMAEYPVRAVAFDNEPAAQRRAEQLCNELAVFPGNTYNLIIESGKDAASADRAEIEQYRAELGLV